jgi:hypothetical protein
MKPAEILDHLEKLAKALSIEFRYEKGDFTGGLCRINDTQILIVNSKLTEEEKIKIFTQALCQLDLNNVYMLPAIREIIQEEQETMKAQPGG